MDVLRCLGKSGKRNGGEMDEEREREVGTGRQGLPSLVVR